MRLTVELTYPGGVDAVSQMLADEEFVRWRAAHSAGEVDRADLTGSRAEGFTVLVRRTLATDQIPAQFRAFVGDRLEVRQAEVWEPPAEGRLVGTVAVEIVGTPVRLTGTVRLEPTPDGGSRQVYEGDVHASIPLFGAVVEEAAANAVRSTLIAEREAGIEWLTRAGRP